MTDRVIAFTRAGIPIGELDAVVVRSQKLQREVRAERAVMQVRSSNITRESTQFRNLIVVLSDKVPTWCGVIWDTRDWADNNINVTLYSCEYLLSFRRTGTIETYNNPPNLIFGGLLKTAQKDESLLIQISSAYIASGGRVTEKEYNREIIFNVINDLASELEYYWWLEPSISTANRLTLRAHWNRIRGIPYIRPLVQGSNFVDVKVTEICDVANRIFAEGNFDDWTDPLEYVAQDAVSRSDFGLIEDVVSDHDISDQPALVSFGISELAKRKQPRMKISGKVVSTPFPKIGDNVTVMLSSDTLGYAGGSSVPTRTVTLRIKSVSYTPEEEAVYIICDNIYWE